MTADETDELIGRLMEKLGRTEDEFLREWHERDKRERPDVGRERGLTAAELTALGGYDISEIATEGGGIRIPAGTDKKISEPWLAAFLEGYQMEWLEIFGIASERGRWPGTPPSTRLDRPSCTLS